jgi:hypothetical protein
MTSKCFSLGALAIFTVKFWAVMWYVANWVDGHLMKAMYDGNFNVDSWSRCFRTAQAHVAQRSASDHV